MTIVIGLAALGLSAGCSTYTLRGRVVEGTENAIMVVPADDPRLGESGVGRARINIHRDPGRLNQELVATHQTARDGSFAIELPAFGAGWMDEQWLIESGGEGYRTLSEIIRLPRNTDRNHLLIMLAPGRATPFDSRDDLWEEYRRYR